jgi:CBS domain-containing protein
MSHLIARIKSYIAFLWYMRYKRNRLGKGFRFRRITCRNRNRNILNRPSVEPPYNGRFALVRYDVSSRVDTVTAAQLKLLLYSLEIYVSEDKPSSRDSPIDEVSKLDFYFAVFPSNFATIKESQYDITNEIRQLIISHPDCQIFIVCGHKSNPLYIDNLADSVLREFNKIIYQLDFALFLQRFEQFTITTGAKIMPVQSSSEVTSIMIPAHDLSTVLDTDKFSDLYVEIFDSNVRHCPVLDHKTDRCIRVVSRRDVIKHLPPSNVPDDIAVKIKLDRAAMNQVRSELVRRPINHESLFPNPQTDLKSVTSKATVKAVVDIFRERQKLAGREIYISGLPVLDDKGGLEGFISYVDILKKFISTQSEFLENLKVSTVGTIARTPAEFSSIRKLRSDDTINIASSQLDDTLRSLPIVSVEDTNIPDEFVGFIDDITVKKYSHTKFPAASKRLEVRYVMTPKNYLPEITPDMKIEYVLPYFWGDSYGCIPPSSFAITEPAQKADNTPYRKLKGILSYTDILKAWWKWNEKQDGNSKKEDKSGD